MKIREKLNLNQVACNKQCNVNLPFCVKDIENDFQHQIIHHFMFRTKNFPPDVKENYFDGKKINKKGIKIKEDYCNEYEDILIERKVHKCNVFYSINLTSDTGSEISQEEMSMKRNVISVDEDYVQKEIRSKENQNKRKYLIDNKNIVMDDQYITILYETIQKDENYYKANYKLRSTFSPKPLLDDSEY